VDDEKKYSDLIIDDGVIADPNYVPNSDEEDSNDELTVDDEKGCEMHVHITDVENLKIEVGLCFKRCIIFFSRTRRRAAYLCIKEKRRSNYSETIPHIGPK